MNLLKQLLNLFKRRPTYTRHAPDPLTRWHLIGNYTFHCDSYVTFARGDRYTGELFFNTKKVCGDDHGKCLSKIDTQSAWDRLLADVGAGESDLEDTIREQLREQRKPNASWLWRYCDGCKWQNVVNKHKCDTCLDSSGNFSNREPITKENRP